MYDIISKYKLPIVSVFGVILLYLGTFAQTPDTYRYLKLTIGGGYGHFFNNFTNVNDQNVVNSKPTISAKLMWQPEHRLRIGFESGYYFMYTTNRIETGSGTVHLTTNMNLVPIFINFSMKVAKHLDLNFGTGWTLMRYAIKDKKSTKDKVVGTYYSMSNYTAGFTYIIPMGRRFDMGAEFRYIYMGKTDDNYLGLLFNFTYKFKEWKITHP